MHNLRLETRGQLQGAVFRVGREPSVPSLETIHFIQEGTVARDPNRMHAPSTPTPGPPVPAGRTWWPDAPVWQE